MNMASTTAQFHHQEIGSETLESMLIPSKSQSEKKAKPCEQALKCPRCDSTNTKFCYYNNYSLSQPRYFCKSCRRYWTKGGTLRNVPVGGGCRKTAKRSSSSKRTHHDHQQITTNPTHTPIPIPSYDHSNAFTSLGIDDHSGFAMPPVAGFLETPFQSLYYGIGDGMNLGLEINGTGMGIGMAGLNQEMGLMGFEEMSGATTSSTAVKQEMCGGGGSGREDGRGLWGFPWQNIVGGDGNVGNWNGIGASNWHGLLNTPLM